MEGGSGVTIPTMMKQYFFEGKKAPDLLKEYDVIGFEADHCLVKYNVDEVAKLAVGAYLKGLHEKFPEYYPEEVCNFDYEKNMGVFLNNAIWDIKHGCLLKLDEIRRVIHAVRGFEKLSDKEIEKLYRN